MRQSSSFVTIYNGESVSSGKNVASPVGVEQGDVTDSAFCCEAVLVIEDDEGIRETLKYALELEGYKVFTAANGRIGINLLSTIPKPCLILLDLMMPEMNGWEFAEAIEKDILLATIPVVVVSAFSDRAKTIRAKGVIKKPVDLDALFKLVAQWCGKGAREKEK